MQQIRKIAIVGNGKAGNYMYQAFKNAGFNVKQFSRSAEDESAKLDTLIKARENFQLILLCIKDNAIAGFSEKLPAARGIVAHISGSRPISDMSSRHPHRGILYPVMSLSADKPPKIKDIPFCLEASDQRSLSALDNLCNSLGVVSYRLDSKSRKQLHLAAVMAQNFSNHLYQMAYEVLNEAELPIEILKPLLLHTVQRLGNDPPFLYQTGPAVRNDTGTMESHEQMLNEENRQLYMLMSKLIQKKHEEEL